MQPQRTIHRSNHWCLYIKDIHQDFSALTIYLIKTLWCGEIEAIWTNRFHEGLPTSSEDHHSVILVVAYTVKQINELLMRVAVKQQRPVVAVKHDLQYSTFSASKTSIGKGV